MGIALRGLGVFSLMHKSTLNGPTAINRHAADGAGCSLQHLAMYIQKLLIVAALWLCTGFAYAQEDDGTLSPEVGNFEFTSEVLLTPLDQDLNVRSGATGILSKKGQAISVFKDELGFQGLRSLLKAPKCHFHTFYLSPALSAHTL